MVFQASPAIDELEVKVGWALAQHLRNPNKMMVFKDSFSTYLGLLGQGPTYDLDG